MEPIMSSRLMGQQDLISRHTERPMSNRVKSGKRNHTKKRQKTPFPLKRNPKTNLLAKPVFQPGLQNKRESALYRLKRLDSGKVDLKSLDLGRKRKASPKSPSQKGYLKKNKRHYNPLQNSKGSALTKARMQSNNRNMSMPPKRTINSSDSLIEELEVDTKYGKTGLTSANFFDDDDSVISQPKPAPKKTSDVSQVGFGDVNSLIRKIKPTNFETSNKTQKNLYVADKKPNKSILKVELMKRKKIKKRLKVKINPDPKVHYVANWKFLNVDMSKEGKMYNHFNRRRRVGNTDDESCKIF